MTHRSSEWPIAVRLVDIRRPLEPLAGLDRYARVRIFVADGPDLVGSVDIHPAGAPAVPAERVRDAIADALGHKLFARAIAAQMHLSQPRSALLDPSVGVSVVVPTCNRPDDLRRCLESLAAQVTRRAVEVLVVDNRPGSGVTRAVAQAFPGVTVIEERRPGLSFARNTGIARARGAIVVATDDDVVAPSDWIEKLVAPFSRDEVAAVTGNVLPIELETQSQCRFEAYGGLGKGFDRIEVGGTWFRERRAAVPTWQLGATANAAFRTSIFRDARIGLLDEALGAGMPTGCSEDTYLFYRILKAGRTIVYEPSAFVWHRHRTSMQELRRQVHAYSRGHVAYQLTTLLRDGDTRALVRLLYSLPKTYARRVWQRLRGWSEYPVSMILLEISGNLAGPWALWQSRRRVRELGASAPLPPAPEASIHVVSIEGTGPQDPPAEPPVAPLARVAR